MAYSYTQHEQDSIDQLCLQLENFGITSSSKATGGDGSKEVQGEVADADTGGSDDIAGEKNMALNNNVNQALRKLMRFTVHRVPHRLSTSKEEELFYHEITSWKFSEYVYKKDPCPLPSLARGLFTEKVSKVENEDPVKSFGNNWRILARGYDKFFNVGEVTYTKWDKIHEFAKGPFHVTGKENGCIILISALPPPNSSSSPALLVTSKHATGDLKTIANPEKSHAAVGNSWILKNLASLNPPRTPEDLAKELWDHKLTAVAELCDDSFEEHVLAYKPERTGLHLHGLNRNVMEFETMPIDQVCDFAKRWGFIEPRWKTFETIEQVKEFTDSVAQDQQWEGDAIEGFVVRGTKIPKKEHDGNAFFWKVKFDEPYLTYREWRELTKQLLTEKAKENKKKPTKGKGVKSKRYRYQLTNLYVDWVDKEIDTHPEKFQNYQQNKGIIAIRDEFLKWAETEAGRDAWGEFKSNIQIEKEEKTASRAEASKKVKEDKDNKVYDKTLIFPISIPGCGKTLLANTLSNLFGFAHTQSDDVQSKKNAAKTFLNNVERLLKENRNAVVVADKNNHLRQHREALLALAKDLRGHSVRTVVLQFDVTSLPQNELHSICSARIVARGENHQSLRPTAAGDHDQILWRFFKEFEAFEPDLNPEDSEFDEVIKIPIDVDMESTVSKVANHLSEILGLPKPTPDRIQVALEKAKGYRPTVKKDMKPVISSPSKRKGAPRYFGILVTMDLEKTFKAIFHQNPQLDSTLIDKISDKKTWTVYPHATLIHMAQLESKKDPENEEVWKYYQDITAKEAVEVQVTIGPRLLWDGRVMSVEVSNITPKEIIRVGSGNTLHITIGTIPAAKPVEGKVIFEKFTKGKDTTEQGGKIHSFAITPFTISGKIQGMYN